MSEYRPETYGDRWASVYDNWFGHPRDEDAAVAFLSELAGSGPALELGIGTGRIALPLARRGIEVYGIDASEKMVEKLRTKPGGADISVAIGDFADVNVEERCSLVYVVFNTFFGLLSQDDQVRCFANVAHCLGERGTFVIEAFVPDPTRFEGGQATQTKQVKWSGGSRDLPARACLPACRHAKRRHKREWDETLPGQHPLRMAFRTRPHGPFSRTSPARTLGRLEPGAFHGDECRTRLRLQARVGGD